MTRTRFSRREIIRRAGGAALLLGPILRARAAGAAPPVRFVSFYFGNGVSGPIAKVFPKKAGAGWDWSQATLTAAALKPHEAYLSIARGVWINVCIAKSDAHFRGSVTWPTGTDDFISSGEEHAPLNASLDQWFAQATNTQALCLSVSPSKNRLLANSFSGQDQPVQPEADPQRAYQSEFASLLSGMVDVTAIKRKNNGRIYVLDAVVGDLKSAQRVFGLGKDERDRLQRYEATLSRIETALRDEVTNAGKGPAKQPPAVAFGSTPTQKSRAQADILVGALGLGLRRSAMFQLTAAYENDIDFAGFIPGASKGGHHNSQHGILGATGDPAKVTPWIFDQIAYLLGQMQKTKEADGSNLLDHSAVLVGTDTPNGLGNQAHNYDADHPTFLFGKAGGALRANVEAPAPAGGSRDHADMLATVARALGPQTANIYMARQRFKSVISEFLV